MKLIKGKKYRLYFPNGKSFIYSYDGIWEGHFCDRCGKIRKCLTFTQGEPDNPTQVAKYGSECIKHIDIEQAHTEEA